MLHITYCISKIGSVKTIQIVLDFYQKDWFDFADVYSYLEDLLEEHIYPDDWYFVPSYGIKPSNSVQIKFDSLVVFLILKKHD